MSTIAYIFEDQFPVCRSQEVFSHSDGSCLSDQTVSVFASARAFACGLGECAFIFNRDAISSSAAISAFAQQPDIAVGTGNIQLKEQGLVRKTETSFCLKLSGRIPEQIQPEFEVTSVIPDEKSGVLIRHSGGCETFFCNEKFDIGFRCSVAGMIPLKKQSASNVELQIFRSARRHLRLIHTGHIIRIKEQVFNL